jgi:hypothetical protein
MPWQCLFTLNLHVINNHFQEAGLQNQGDISGPTCPYLLRSSWEYADVDQPGWQWVYDYTANLVRPLKPSAQGPKACYVPSFI